MAYRVRNTFSLSGRPSQVVSRGNGGVSSLTNIMNYFLLADPSCVQLDEDDIDRSMKGFITGQILREMKSLPPSVENLQRASDLMNMVSMTPEDIRLNPMLSSMSEFEETKSYDIFNKLKIQLFHSWHFVQKDADRFSETCPWTYTQVKDGVEKYKQTADSTQLTGRGDIEEAEQVKMAIISSQQEMGLSVQDPAPPTLTTGIDWGFLSTVLDRMHRLGRALSADSLSWLRKNLGEDNAAILCWNDELCVICKHKGIIFVLVDEEDVLVTHPEAVWKTLGIGEQKEVFVDGKFAPLSTNVVMHRCPSSNCSLEFHSEINYKRHQYIHLPASKVEQGSSLNEDAVSKMWDEILPDDAQSILKLGGLFVKDLFGSSLDEIILAFFSSPRYRLISASPDETKVIKSIKHLLSTKKPSFEELLGILHIASEGTFMCNEILRHKELLEKVVPGSDNLWNAVACFSLKIEQELAQRTFIRMKKDADKWRNALLEEEERDQKDKTVIEEIGIRVESTELGLPIEVDAPDDIQIRSGDTVAPSSPSSASSYINLPEVDVKTERKLLPSDILHWPPLQHEEYFPTFAARRTLVTACTILSGKKVSIALTRVGRRVAKRLLRFILKAHRAGKSWNGDLTIDDIRVRSHKCIIAKEAEADANKQGMIADLQRFIEILAPYYSHEEIGGYPAFFHEFHVDAMDIPERESENFAVYQKYMRNHLAFIGPLDRRQLYIGLFIVCDMLRDKNDSAYRPLCCDDKFPDWRSFIEDRDPFYSLYYYDFPEDLKKAGKQPYWRSYWDFLRFLRNYGCHAHRHTKVNGVQQVTEVGVLDLMLSDEFASSITRLILFMMYIFKMEGPFFSTWDAFVTTDGLTDDDDDDEENGGN